MEKILLYVLQIAYEWSHEKQAKIVVIEFFLNFKNFIPRFDFQNVYVKPNWSNFSNFWTQK